MAFSHRHYIVGQLESSRYAGTFTGDLSSLLGLSWDEFLPSSSVIRTSMFLLGGTNNTVYHGTTADQSVVTTNSWENRLVPFDFSSGLWSLNTGIDSFENVLSNVTGLFIQMDVTTSNFGSLPESSVDNVALLNGTPNPPPIPEPATILLFGTGLVGLLGWQYRKKRLQ